MKDKMYIREKDLPEGLIKNIERAFYKKEALSDLLNNKVPQNQAYDNILDKYTEAYADWQKYVNELGTYIFGDRYGNIDVNMNINFNSSTEAVKLTFDNSIREDVVNSISNNITPINVGFISLKDAANNTK